MRESEKVRAVKNTVVSNAGRKVMVKSNKGRNKYDIAEGVIFQTYPYVFLVQIKDHYSESLRTLSFTYSDIITKEVELDFC